MSSNVALAITTLGASTLVQSLFDLKAKKPAPVDRGKQNDIRFSLPGFGEPIVRGWGTFRVAPTWFWHTPIVHTTRTTPGQSGGKGSSTPPTPDTVDHIYTTSLAGAIHDGLIYKGASRIWFNADLVYNANFATNFANTDATRYEAEHGVLAGGASVAAQLECSGENKVTSIGSGGSVTIHCDVATTGNYEVAVFYTSTSLRTYKVSVNGGANADLVCTSSGGASLVAVEMITLTLTAGANTIAFSNSGAAAPDLDCIDITPALVFTPEGEDRRSFTGLITPGHRAPSDPDIQWATANEIPTFSDSAGGVTAGGFYTATLSKWGNAQIRIYPGSETQQPDSLIIADKGADNAPAYRGTAYMVIEGLQIPNGSLPNVTVELNQGVRECATIVQDVYEAVGVARADVDVSALAGLVIGDSTGFDPGTYAGITWTGLSNATQGTNGAITKTSGATNTWNAFAQSGASIGAGTDASIRFTAQAGTFMIGFAKTATPGSALPHPYDQVPFAVILNLNSNPGQELKNSIQMSLGGFNDSSDVGTWAVGDGIQVEIRNGRFGAYQNGLLLTGFSAPVPSFPLIPIFVGYATGGGCSAASFATGANIGSEPIVANGGALVSPQQQEASELIIDLQTRFQFDLPEVDGKIKAVLRAGAVEVTITEEELRARRNTDAIPDGPVRITSVNPLELPFKVEVNYLDPQLDFHNNMQSDRRLIAGPQKNVVPISLAMVETADNMHSLAALLRHQAEMESRKFEFTTGPKYMKLHQGAILSLVLLNATHTVRVTGMKFDLPAGLCEFSGVRQAASLYLASGAGSAGSGVETSIVPIPGATKGLFIDAPLVEPENTGDQVQAFLYVAMAGRGSGSWPGGFINREFPANSGNYEQLTSSDKAATVGKAASTLATVSDPTVLDTTGSLMVDLYYGELESVTLAELNANPKLNLLWLAKPTGEGEYIQFKDATPGVAVAPFIRRYTLTNFLRGRYHTEGNVSIHTSSDDVVLMNSAIKVIPMSSAHIGVAVNYKFITVGQDPDDAPAISNTWRGMSLKEPQPTNVVITKDANSDWLIQAGIRQGAPDTMSVEIWTSADRSNPANRKRTLIATPGTTQAALLASTDGEWSEEAQGFNLTNHAFKNNFAPAGGFPEGFSGTSIQAIDHPWQRFDFEMAFDNVLDGGFLSDLPAATTTFPVGFFVALHERANAEAPYAVPAFADCPLSIEWIQTADGPDGTIKEVFRSYGTIILTRDAIDAGGHPFTMVSGEVADNVVHKRPGPRYSFSLNGGELAIYSDFVPGGGNKHLVKVIPAVLNYPLRLSALVASDHFYLRNVMFAGATQHSTIYSKREQIVDFSAAQTKLFLRLYKDGPLIAGIPLDIETPTIP